jgi:hypothetical protein
MGNEKRHGSGEPQERNLLAAFAVVAVVSLAYSILISASFLPWVYSVVPLAFLYLVWRFVRAHERIADALEARTAVESDTPLAEPDPGVDERAE